MWHHVPGYIERHGLIHCSCLHCGAELRGTYVQTDDADLPNDLGLCAKHRVTIIHEDKGETRCWSAQEYGSAAVQTGGQECKAWASPLRKAAQCRQVICSGEAQARCKASRSAAEARIL